MGNTWTNYQGGLFRKNIFRLRINNNDDIFVGSENEGVFRSTDGGNDFEQVGLPTSKVNNMVFNGDSLIFTSTPSGVQKYNKQSQLWTNLGLHQVEAVSITPGNKLYAATLDGLYESFDLGNTWSLNNFFSDTTIAVYNVLAVNNDTIFAATSPNLLRSFDGGNSWNILLGVKTGWLRSSILYNNFDQSLLSSSIDNGEYVLLKSFDLGNNFNIVISNIGSMLNSCLSFNNEIGFLATGGGTMGSLYRSTNSGANWFISPINESTRSVFVDNLGQVLAGAMSGLYYSSNHGSNFIDLGFEIGQDNYVSSISKQEKFFLGTYRTGLYEFTIITSIDDPIEPVIYYDLTQNYPNPFNPSTTISYQIPKDGIVTLKIFDILGSEVATLVNEEKVAGHYEVNFNASSLASGVYIYTLQVNGFSSSKKMLLLK